MIWERLDELDKIQGIEKSAEGKRNSQRNWPAKVD